MPISSCECVCLARSTASMCYPFSPVFTIFVEVVLDLTLQALNCRIPDKDRRSTRPLPPFIPSCYTDLNCMCEGTCLVPPSVRARRSIQHEAERERKQHRQTKRGPNSSSPPCLLLHLARHFPRDVCAMLNIYVYIGRYSISS